MLSKQQLQQLKSQAHPLKSIIQIGKNGLSDELIESVNNAFNNRELIKVSILQNCPYDKKELAFDLARLTNSELIQIIGRVFILYKENDE